MTKADLISAINTQLTAVITQAKVRASALLGVNAIYPSKVTDNEGTTTVLTVALSGVSYTINLWKQGNNVNVSGRITNGTGGTISGVDIITITNSEYLPDATGLNPFRFYGNSVLFLVTNTNKIRAVVWHIRY